MNTLLTLKHAKAAPRTAEILIYEDIGGDPFFGGLSARQFADDVAAMGKLDILNVRINSLGGSVFEGVTIHNTLARNSARVVVDIDGRHGFSTTLDEHNAKVAKARAEGVI